ncbi:hypothetical protein FHT28_004329 [Rhizobium sp. SG570]|nr:hypothetical protein [Rhizobium sp. SG570]
MTSVAMPAAAVAVSPTTLANSALISNEPVIRPT